MAGFERDQRRHSKVKVSSGDTAFCSKTPLYHFENQNKKALSEHTWSTPEYSLPLRRISEFRAASSSLLET